MDKIKGGKYTTAGLLRAVVWKLNEFVGEVNKINKQIVDLRRWIAHNMKDDVKLSMRTDELEERISRLEGGKRSFGERRRLDELEKD